MKPEGVVQSETRIRASQKGARLWRNNVGVSFTEDGTPVRYGLANESQVVNKSVKSSDLIGITPVVITQDMVGQTLGVFTAYEIKREAWKYMDTPRERAQSKFLEIVRALGGIAKFITDKEQV